MAYLNGIAAQVVLNDLELTIHGILIEGKLLEVSCAHVLKRIYSKPPCNELCSMPSLSSAKIDQL